MSTKNRKKLVCCKYEKVYIPLCRILGPNGVLQELDPKECMGTRYTFHTEKEAKAIQLQALIKGGVEWLHTYPERGSIPFNFSLVKKDEIKETGFVAEGLNAHLLERIGKSHRVPLGLFMHGIYPSLSLDPELVQQDIQCILDQASPRTITTIFEHIFFIFVKISPNLRIKYKRGHLKVYEDGLRMMITDLVTPRAGAPEQYFDVTEEEDISGDIAEQN